MNSQNINADYLKIVNELFEKVNKPQKMTTMEKISNSSKDFFLEGKFREPKRLLHSHQSTNFIRLFHSNLICDDFKNKYSKVYQDFFSQSKKNKSLNGNSTLIKETFDRIILKKRLSDISSFNSKETFENKSIKAKKELLYNMVNEKPPTKLKEDNIFITRGLRKQSSVPNLLYVFNRNSFLNSSSECKTYKDKNSFERWDKLKDLIRTPSKIINSNLSLSRNNSFLHKSGSVDLTRVNSSVHSIKA